MGALADFLTDQEETLRREAGEARRIREEWLEAIGHLFADIERWIADADNGRQLLTFEPTTSETRESKLGRYAIPTLSVRLGSRVATIVPRSRFMVASIETPGQPERRCDGMVEIRDGVTATHYLFRLMNPDGDDWFIQSVERWNSDPKFGRVDPLDQEHFEAALKYVLV